MKGEKDLRPVRQQTWTAVRSQGKLEADFWTAGRRLLFVVPLCCLALSLAGAARAEDHVLTQRHVYEQDGELVDIPQDGATTATPMPEGREVTVRPGAFVGFVSEEPSKRLTMGQDQEVVFRYHRATAQPLARISLVAISENQAARIRELIQGQNLHLTLEGRRVATQTVDWPEGDAEAVVVFPALYTHTPEGEPIAYQIETLELPEALLAETQDLHLTLRAGPRRVRVSHLYTTPEGLAMIPQRGAIYTLECPYGESLVVPNRDFDGYVSDLDTPSIYLAQVTEDQDISFLHQRAAGVVAQLVILPGQSRNPTLLPALIRPENPVQLWLEGEAAYEAVAVFSGVDEWAVVPFLEAYTHSPEGEILAYELVLAEDIPGFAAQGEGLQLDLTPLNLTVTVRHCYEQSSGMALDIPQAGATEEYTVCYGDDLVVPAAAFSGFAGESEESILYCLVEGREVVILHERTMDSVTCQALIAGGTGSNLPRLTEALAASSVRITGGELPALGLLDRPQATAAAAGVEVYARFDNLYTHGPEGIPYTYDLTLEGFGGLPGGRVGLALAAGQSGGETLLLPSLRISLRALMRQGDAQAPVPGAAPVTVDALYGDSLTLTPPALPGYVLAQEAPAVEYLETPLTLDVLYARQTDPAPVTGQLAWRGTAKAADRPASVTMRLVRGNEAGEEAFPLAVDCGPASGDFQAFAFEPLPTHDLTGRPFTGQRLEVDAPPAYDLLVQEVNGGYLVELEAQEEPSPASTHSTAPSAAPSTTPSTTPGTAPSAARQEAHPQEDGQ